MANGKRVVIVGSGPAGYVGAIRAAQLGMKVTVVDNRPLGGTCLNRGCIPTKALLGSAAVVRMMEHAEEFGVKVKVEDVDWEMMRARSEKIVGRLVKGIETLFKANAVEFVSGEARVGDAKTLVVTGEGGERKIEGDFLLIASGSESLRPRAFFGEAAGLRNADCGMRIDSGGGEQRGGEEGQDKQQRERRIITSDEALRMEELPMRAVIVGGGYIGCEFASLWSDLGVEVTMVEMLERLLMLSDEAASEATYKALRKRGVKVKLGVKIEKLTERGEGVAAELSEGGTVEGDVALVAVGRKLNSDVNGLAELGVKLKGNAIEVDGHGRTNVGGVYAAGDVTGGVLLAHYASSEGIVAVENMAGIEREMERRVVPSCVFTNPDVASVGLTEKEAREKHGEVKVGVFELAHLGKALAAGETAGFVKVMADGKTEEVLGVTIVGHEASSMIGEATMVMKMHGKLADVGEMIHAHPTMPEGMMEAALDAMGRAIHKLPRNKKN